MSKKIIVVTNGKETENTTEGCKKVKLDKNLLKKFDKNPKDFLEEIKKEDIYKQEK
jgi:hypothetical protein